MLSLASITDTHLAATPESELRHETFLAQLAVDLATHKVQALIHNGDWVHDDLSQLKKSFSLFRKHIKIPILTTWGNHDAWLNPTTRDFYSYSRVQEQRTAWAKEFNIHHLQNNPVVIEDVIILGFDGWYGLHAGRPPTKDLEYMARYIESAPTHDYLSNQADKELARLLETPTDAYRAVVGVTHFPPFTDSNQYLALTSKPAYLDFLTEKLDILLLGHSHQKVDVVKNDCRIINPGLVKGVFFKV